MPRFPTARRRLAGAAAALLLLLAPPWPRGAGLDALLGRLLAVWHEVAAAVEAPPPAEEPEGSESTQPPDPRTGEDRGPSLDPNGSNLGDGEEPAQGTPP